ncbi:sulfotransferase domain-containing protein [Sphingomonas sp.]|uniref:sulfotransferase domain-containing protein n=1 Tax=Sphingomonas sp. TaxID=28214 RepID=UPI002E0DBCBE|nr:sulfotransferase domain-containing protein [Sphingomonas sp.]HEV7287961.1 sulfotransferase domain-containing protein [Sphingomonas sp.]
MNQLRLLASYPRSGNTWVRAVLSGLLNEYGAVALNALGGVVAADRALIDEALEIETSDLLPEEEARLRAMAFRNWQPTSSFPLKTHDAWLPAPGADTPPFARDQIAAIVLIVRDPRDVVLSLARYFGLALPDAIEALGHPRFSLGISEMGLRPHVAQLVSSWSDHARSWLDADLPLTLVRYEDLVAAPRDGFAAIARAFDIPAPPDRLARVVETTRLDRLAAAEAQTGFRESSRFAPNRFFGAGTPGAWRDVLTPAQAAQIVRDHGATMNRLGYIED